jgi:hypothetical protein
MGKKRSPTEDLFEKIYGFRPQKEGVAYEMLAAAVSKLLGLSSGVLHDQMLRGMFSETLHQVDILLDDAEGRCFGEAKDYSVREEKVGRDDLQKLGGALGDTEVRGGVVFSATGYTAPARKYAGASEEINRKTMDLYTLRPAVQKDTEGRITSVTVEATAVVPTLDQARFEPVFSSHGGRELQRLAEGGRLALGDRTSAIDRVLDANGSTLMTLEDMRIGWDPAVRDAARTPDRTAYASLRTPGGHIELGGRLFEILGLTYRIPVSTYLEKFTLTSHGAITLVIKDERGNLDKTITDEDLSRVGFTESGEAVLKEKC